MSRVDQVRVRSLYGPEQRVNPTVRLLATTANERTPLYRPRRIGTVRLRESLRVCVYRGAAMIR